MVIPMLGLMNSFLLKLSMQTLFSRIVLLSCLAVEGMHPLTAHSAPYSRSCTYQHNSRERIGIVFWKESDVYRYNNGIDITICASPFGGPAGSSRVLKINCIHKVEYKLQNDGSYLKTPGLIEKGSVNDILCDRYFF